MTINSNTNLEIAASAITHDSELFADEVQTVRRELAEILAEANRWGCTMQTTILDMWGGKVVVTAVPTTRKHSWSF